MSQNGNGKLSCFPMYPADFLLDPKVQQMKPHQRGFYALLLFQAWSQHPVGTLPADDDALAKLLGLSDEEWQQDKDAVLAPFHFADDGRWHQKRMELEYAKAHRSYVARSEAGKIGNAQRWHSDRIAIAERSDSGPLGMPPSQCDRLAIDTEREKEQEESFSPFLSSSSPCTPSSISPLIPSSKEEKEKEREALSSAQFVLESEPENKPVRRKTPMMDSATVTELSLCPAYQGIDVVKESWKFHTWCEVNRKPESKARFINWLNRVV